MEYTYKEAIRQALYDELNTDESVVLFGEDDRRNLYGYTEGLFDTFGDKRVIDIPLSEAGILGTAIGASICGLRPVVDFTNENFLYVAMDQIASMLAKIPYMFNETIELPVTMFCSAMYGGGNASQHSDRIHSMLANIAGLTVICPASAADMYWMLREGIRSNSPVICLADRALFWTKEDIPEKSEPRIGRASLIQEGTDLTIVSVAGSRKYVMEANEELLSKGISADIIDVRSVKPLDFNTIENSVKKTGRVVICDTANKTCSVASEIAALLAQNTLSSLKTSVRLVTNEDMPIPFAPGLEQKVMVNTEKIKNAVYEACL